MSRIGNKAISLPLGMLVKKNDGVLYFSYKGKDFSFFLPRELNCQVFSGSILLDTIFRDKKSLSLWGLTRVSINNLVRGMSIGFEKKLEIIGVGYKALLSEGNLVLSLGFSHDIIYPIPDLVSIKVLKPTEILVTSSSKYLVGQVSAEIRNYRKPEPYKGKGIRYSGEYIFRKEGKKK